MDTHGHLQEQKDFMSTLFNPTVDHSLGHPHGGQVPDVSHHQQHQHQQQHGGFNGSNSLGHGILPSQMSTGNANNLPLDMDMLGSIMAMQGIENQFAHSSNQQASYNNSSSNNSSGSGSNNPQMLMEQQFKLTQLQQLQQLQNQIFQQQIALISGGQSGNHSAEMSPELNRAQHPQMNQGLPTPGPSNELRPQQNNEYVSPMSLVYMDAPPETYSHNMQQQQSHHPHHSNHSQYSHLHGSMSAPANIVFQSNNVPLSGGDLDLDISPLTSPWLGAYQNTVHPRQTNPNQNSNPNPNKRTASLSGDEDSSRPARKRQSPAIRPTNPIPSSSSLQAAKKHVRASKSTSSAPMLRSTRSRRNSTVAEGDTPSPVDLSMPPPAPPSASSTPLQGSTVFTGLQLTPVTPASIMKLGRLGLNSGLSPPNRDMQPAKKDIKGKGTTKAKAASEAAGSRKISKKSSPNIRPLLPAGDGMTQLLGSPTTGDEPPRKTSHKAAEQKRRDSLKTTFDDLRHLLPPIPFPSDENFPDEPILPGALPPRGPPKTGGEGPNKGISKLQLLRCGNELIRQLKGRVERRDEEIGKLRREVLRLRVNPGVGEAEEDVDLERDLDAVEGPSSMFGREAMAVDDDADDEDGD